MSVPRRIVLLTPRLWRWSQVSTFRSLSSLSAECRNEGTELEQDGNSSSPKENASNKKSKRRWKFSSEFEETIAKEKQPPFMLEFGKASTLNVPTHLDKAISRIQEKYTKGQHKTLQKKAQHFVNQIVCRHRPMESDELAQHGTSLQQHMLEKILTEHKTKGHEVGEEEMHKINTNVRQKVVNALRKHVYHHQQIKYDSQQALMYMEGLMRSNYQHLTAIFREIKRRQPSFAPRTMMDFGSGLGCAMWAASSVWPSQLYEFMNVDRSGDMNTLAQLLLQGGLEEGEPYFKEVYFRRFLPATSDRLYNLVVCDLTLLELPDMNSRLDVLYNLWSKTEDFLVITEFGTQAGFHTILEARQFILELHRNERIKDGDRLEGHVFAPCPHDIACPKMNSSSICKFSQSPHKSPRTCYVVLRKGSRETADQNYPRIVKGPHLSQKTYSMQLCCPDGVLKNAAVQKKATDRAHFRVMKRYRHGDLIPLEEKNSEEINLEPE